MDAHDPITMHEKGPGVQTPGLFFVLPLLLWWLALYWTYSSAWPRPFDDWKNVLFYTGAGYCCLYQLWQCRAELNLRINALTVCVATYALTLVLSLFGEHTPAYEGLLEIARLLLWGGCVWSLSRLPATQWRWIARLAVVSAALIAVCTWVQLRGFRIWPFSNVFMAPIGHVSYYGDCMALHVPLALWLAVTSRRRWAMLLWGVAAGLIALGLWLAAARASIVGFGAGLLCALVWLRRARLLSWRQLLWVPAGAVALTVTLFLVQPASIRGESALQRLRQVAALRDWSDIETATSGRWHGYVTTWRMMAERPVAGWGVGSFRFIYPEYDYRNAGTNLHHNTATAWYMHPHNELLHQGMELGWVGLACFLVFWGLLYAHGIRVLSGPRDPATAWCIILAFTGLTIALVSWQFSTSFLFPLSRLLTAFYGALLWQHARSTAWIRMPMRRSAWVLGSVVVAATLFLGAYHGALYALVRSARTSVPMEKIQLQQLAHTLAPGAFEPLYVYAITALQHGAPEEARKLIDRAYAAYPFVPVVLFQTARQRLRMGDPEAVRMLLQHALANDPNFGAARKLLDSLIGISPGVAQ